MPRTCRPSRAGVGARRACGSTHTRGGQPLACPQPRLRPGESLGAARVGARAELLAGVNPSKRSSRQRRERTRTTTLTRDSAGRIGMKHVSGGGTAVPAVNTTYDATTGRSISSTTAAAGGEPARTISQVHDSQRRVVSNTDATGAVTRSRYDIDGRLVEESDPKGTTRYGYDVAGRLVRSETRRSAARSPAPTTPTGTSSDRRSRTGSRARQPTMLPACR